MIGTALMVGLGSALRAGLERGIRWAQTWFNGLGSAPAEDETQRIGNAWTLIE